MKFHSRNHSAITLSLLMFALILVTAPARAEAPAVAGEYTLVSVNGVRLPAAAWFPNGDEDGCRQQIVKATLLIDDEGGWAGLQTRLQICRTRGGSESRSKPTSVILQGTYEVDGEMLAFTSDGIVSSGQIDKSGQVLVIQTVGVGKYDGQTAEYIYHRI